MCFSITWASSDKCSYTPLAGKRERRGDKEGHHKRKTARELSKSCVPKQIYFSVKNDNAIALKYIYLRSSSV
jgi:hypothetical protein